MADDPNAPRVLMSVANDVEAAGIVTALEAHGIRATTIGGFTSGFRAEAPGDIKVVVRAMDFEPARCALAEIREERNDVGRVDDESEHRKTPAHVDRRQRFVALTIAAMCSLEGVVFLIVSSSGVAEASAQQRWGTAMFGLLDLGIAALALKFLRPPPPRDEEMRRRMSHD